MKFSCIICTYMRPQPLLNLLQSIKSQELYPDEILIVDGSRNTDTEISLQQNSFQNLKYFLVLDQERGLTKQRNFGIKKVADEMEIVCFLDDDTILQPDYFKELISTYTTFPKALGVGGYICNEIQWQKTDQKYQPKSNEFVFEQWKRTDGSRFILRKKLGLDSNVPPGYSPEFSHGRSISFLPPSGKTYRVEQLMGGVSSFRKVVFNTFQFSTYFEGYGLYEDADFTLRLSKIGELYVNTAARLGHYHDSAGRPNKYQYGKMVVRNGWYVWRVKHPKPSARAVLKWHSITLLLTLVRFSNIFTTPKKKEAFTEFIGRVFGWLQLFVNKPKME